MVGVTDFLLELRSEEIPARMQAGARAELEKLFRKEMDAAGVALGAISVWSTPRRLALIARDLPEATTAVSEELKGPKVGAPPQALEGFLRKTGLTQDQLTERDGIYFAVTEKPGRATAEVLAEAIPAIIRAFAWPKSMRWGAASLSTESPRWVRPLSSIVAIFGEELVECQVGEVQSGFATKGHRFHCPGEITIGSAADYQEKLRACHVIVDHEERQNLIRTGVAQQFDAMGLEVIADEGLVIENAGLTEWPLPLIGGFDEAFLAVPPEVIQLTARLNQKYFMARDSGGDLAPVFACVANVTPLDGGAAIVAGNEKVLAARLSDAKFFWDQDLKVSLAVQAEKLSQIVFHEKLGTVADKVERVAKLARWLCEEGIIKPSSLQGRGLGEGASAASAITLQPLSPALSPEGEREALATLAERAARLCKADLVTGMVGEFPELQGVMGGHLARAQGEPDAVADAIRDHYKPVGQGDDVPTAPVTVAVSLADKLDTLAGFWAVDEKPTGSKDPFALRRAAISIASLILANQLRCGLMPLLDQACVAGSHAARDAENAVQIAKIEAAKSANVSIVAGMAVALNVAKPFGVYDRNFIVQAHDLLNFLADRLKVQQREAGVRHDLIDAVFALGGEDDLVRLLARVKALQAFVGTGEGRDLLAAYKRAANILKGAGRAFSPSTCDGEVASRSDDGGAGSEPSPSTTASRRSPSPSQVDGEDKALHAALDSAEPLAATAIEAEDFEAAMTALASLRAPIDAFFEGVMVNDPDEQKRAFRLGLLVRFRDAVHQVADFSKIEG